MDQYENQLLEKLQKYQKLQKEIEVCQEEIETLLLVYNFDIESIVQNYPIIQTFCSPGSRKPHRRMRAWFSR